MKQIYFLVAVFFVIGGTEEIRANTEYIKTFETGCDAQSGVSPGEVFICGTETFDLYPLLLGPVDPGGSWSGPVGWNGNGTANGPINPDTDSFGIYTYSVEGTDGCISATEIEVTINDLGILYSMQYCAPFSIELSIFLNDTLPTDGVWIAPNGIIVPAGTVSSSNDDPGHYTYLFNDENGCQSSGVVNLSFTPDLPITLEDGYYEFCDPAESICLSDLLNDPEGAAQNLNVQWLVETADETFLDFFPYDTCAVLSELYDLDVDLIFTIAIGNLPCTPHFIETIVHFEPISQYGDTASAAICVNFSEANLNSYLPASSDPDGYWIDVDGNTQSGTIDPGNYTANSSTYFSYISPGDDGCQRLDAVDVSFLASTAESCACQYSVEMTVDETVICEGDQAEISVEFSDGVGPYSAIVSSAGGVNGIIGESSPLIYSVSPDTSGTFTLLWAADFNCYNAASEVVEISLESIQSAGNDIYWDYCSTDSILNLVDILDDEADGGGFFFPEASLTLNSAHSGNYFYVVGGPVCPSDTAVLTVEIPNPLIANNVSAICSEDSLSFIVSYDMTEGSPPYAAEPGGAWAGNSFVSNPIPITTSGGSVQFLVSDAGACPSITVFASILDDDGENLCDQLVGTSAFNAPNESLLIYPNPWDGFGSLGIDLNHLYISDQMVNIQLNDLTGRMVYQDVLNFTRSTAKYELTPKIALGDGVYLLSVVTNIGVYTSRVLISQKK